MGGGRPCGLLTCPLPRQLELDSKFRNHTCGLCGDYNGLQTYSEFLSEGECLLGGLSGRVRAAPWRPPALLKAVTPQVYASVLSSLGTCRR